MPADSATVSGVAAVDGKLEIHTGDAIEADYTDSDGLDFAPRDRMWGGQLSLSRRLGATTHAWLSVSRGFKAGGFNIGASIPAERAQYDPRSSSMRKRRSWLKLRRSRSVSEKKS